MSDATVPIVIPPEVREIAERLEAAGHAAWCVGGAVRDALLGDPQTDFDLATSAAPEVVQRLFPRTLPIGVKFGTVGVFDRKRRLHEVTTFRSDVSTDGRHAVVEYGASLEEDLARRDFTINAIAYHPITGELRDPFDGIRDLRAGVVRAVGEPAARFREDYLRILRALRFSARFGFAIEPATWEAAKAAASGLARLSAERVREEWVKGLSTAKSVGELTELWVSSGAAAVWLPELRPASGADLDPRPRDPVVLTVLLTTDPVAALRRLKASNAEIGRAAAMIASPPRPDDDSDLSARRWLAAAGLAADDLVRAATLREGADPPWAQAVRRVRERGDAVSRGQLAVSGHDLAAEGLVGPAIGQLLGRLLDRVVDDPSLNTRERLLALARELR